MRSRAVAALHPQVMAQCLRHTLPQRSGSSQQRSKIEEVGPCEGTVEGGREQTHHVCRDHQDPQALHMCIDMYVGVCVCVRARVCVCTYAYAYVCLTSEIGRYICMCRFACLHPCTHVGHNGA